jgi:hypothetical protein
MTRRRAWLWCGGFLAIGVLSTLIAWPDEMAGLGPVILVLTFGFVGLVVEFLVALGSPPVLSRAHRREPPPDAPPADGQVEIVPVVGVRAQPNAHDGRFGRFLALERAEEGAAGRRAPSRAAPALLGRVAIVALFLGRDGHEWSDKEMARAFAALVRAGAWIEREAMRWGAAVHVLLADAVFAVADDREPEEVEIAMVPEGDREAPDVAHASSRALAGFSRAAARLGFADAAELTRRINARIAADGHVWLLLPRRGGRSFAVPADLTDLPGVTLAVCHAREANFPEPLAGPPFVDPITVVHELLHLFGATDKYGVPLAAFPPGMVSERDVMCLNHESLARLRVDPLTALELGWTSWEPGTPAPQAPGSARTPGEPTSAAHEQRPPGPGRGAAGG